MKDTVEGIMIILKVDSQQALFVLLAADGTVNRLGTGAANNTENDLFIGISQPPLFNRLQAKIQPQWFDLLGQYDVPEKKGLPCELTILMKHADARESGLQFLYGSESQGPPDDIRQFVVDAIEITDSWYNEQKQMVSKSEPVEKKPWWKFW